MWECFHFRGKVQVRKMALVRLVISVICFLGKCFMAVLVISSGPGAFVLLVSLIVSLISSNEHGLMFVCGCCCRMRVARLSILSSQRMLSSSVRFGENCSSRESAKAVALSSSVVTMPRFPCIGGYVFTCLIFKAVQSWCSLLSPFTKFCIFVFHVSFLCCFILSLTSWVSRFASAFMFGFNVLLALLNSWFFLRMSCLISGGSIMW